MFLGDPPGNYDRILDFSTAVTGSLFFVPTADFLDEPPPLPGPAEDGLTQLGAEGEASAHQRRGKSVNEKRPGRRRRRITRDWRAHGDDARVISPP